jgi:formate hydrogenlyase subunit 4
MLKNPRFGKILSEKTKLLISNNSKGMVEIRDKNKNLINCCKNATVAAKSIGIHKTTIGRYIKSGKIIINNHLFKNKEAELVAGYSTEYSSMGFAMFFIAEYGNIVFMSWLNVLLFFGGSPFGLTIIKLSLLLFMFIWVRVAFPRYRYDQLMRLGWKSFLPLSLGFISFYSTIFLLIH